MTEEIEEKDRPRAAITLLKSKNVEIVRQFIDDNPHISLHQLEAQTLMSYGTIERIIHNNLYLQNSYHAGSTITLRQLKKQTV